MGEQKSTSKTILETYGRLRSLKQNDWKLESESLAIAWAAMLHSLLTQLKEQLRKDSIRLRMLLIMVLLMDQFGVVDKEDKGSKQIFVSPSMTMWGHL